MIRDDNLMTLILLEVQKNESSNGNAQGEYGEYDEGTIKYHQN